MTEATPQIASVVIGGGEPGTIVRNDLQLTGCPPLMPDWALGF